MELRAGTSGFSYKAWKGSFYPEDLPAGEMLRHYAGELPAVEINNTFYRMPRASMLEGWRAAVPETFRFALKASQRITHRARLKDAADSVDFLWSASAALGPTRGPLLFQLPPNFRKDAERLRRFLAALPDGLRPALEFRHESWFDDEVTDVLREGGAALVAADVDPEDGEPDAAPELVATADWGYLRLRRAVYEPEDLAAWAGRIAAQSWREAYVFFKHEDGAAGPRFARELQRCAGGA